MDRAFELCSQRSGQSFSQAPGTCFPQAISAVFADERMSSEVMPAGHLQATPGRASACGGDYLIAVQDTTFYNYTSLPAMEGLGDIRPGVKGIIQHNVLLLSSTGLPLALADQQYRSRHAGEEAAARDGEGKDVFKEKQAAQWYLLTSLASQQLLDTEGIVSFYSLRRRTERLHYTLRSGALKVEKLQFDDRAAMIHALAFYSVAGWRLPALTCQLRAEPAAAATTCFEPEEICLLQAVSKKAITTLKQATLAMAGLVNFVPCEKQPLPGIQVLVQAIERFYYLKMGAHDISD